MQCLNPNPFRSKTRRSFGTAWGERPFNITLSVNCLPRTWKHRGKDKVLHCQRTSLIEENYNDNDGPFIVFKDKGLHIIHVNAIYHRNKVYYNIALSKTSPDESKPGGEVAITGSNIERNHWN